MIEEPECPCVDGKPDPAPISARRASPTTGPARLPEPWRTDRRAGTSEDGFLRSGPFAGDLEEIFSGT